MPPGCSKVSRAPVRRTRAYGATTTGPRAVTATARTRSHRSAERPGNAVRTAPLP